jgi:aspartate carbamoyltransferase catalytic subunit
MQINEATSSASKGSSAVHMMQKKAGSGFNDRFHSATGESLGDTMRCLQCYADAVVLRHPVRGAAAEASAALGARTVLLNAGDGTGEHPTQALLDFVTIVSELQLPLAPPTSSEGGATLLGGGGVDGLTITMVGDLKHGRTVHSLAKLLSIFSGVRLNYVCPSALAMPEDVQEAIRRQGTGTTQQTHAELTPELLASTDVL